MAPPSMEEFRALKETVETLQASVEELHVEVTSDRDERNSDLETIRVEMTDQAAAIRAEMREAQSMILAQWRPWSSPAWPRS